MQLALVSPFPMFFDSDGTALDEGYIWIGPINQNPQTTQIPVYWDKAGTQPVAQPIRTLNGYPMRSGSPATFFASTSYSISVLSKKGRLVYYAADSTQFDNYQSLQAALADQTTSTNGSGMIGYKLNTALSVGRTVNSKLSEFVSIKDFGAVGDGTTNDTAALTNALAFCNTVAMPAGQYRITSSMNIATGKRLQFRDGASLTVDTGQTITFRGQVEAGVEQLFFGAGTVLGLRFVRPEWFGATRTGTAHDDQPAFQKAQNCMEAGILSDGNDMILQMMNGDYGLGSQVVCTPNIASKIHWKGQGGNTGTRLVALAAWTGNNGVVKLAANAVNTGGCSCSFTSFRVVPQTPGSGSTIGILIGDDALLRLIGGDQESCLFEDVNSLNFAICWKIVNVRLFTFRRCSGWVDNLASGKCLQIMSNAANQFTGDLDFYNWQSVADSTGSVSLEINASVAATAQTAGIRFFAAIFYYNSAFITSTGGGRTFDIWFIGGWQFDATRGTAFNVSSSGASSHTQNVNFLDGYVVGALTGSAPLFNVFSTAGGRVTTINIQNNYLGQFWGDVISFNTVDTCKVLANRFVEASVNGGSLVNFTACSNMTIVDNTYSRLDGTGTIQYQVTNVGGSNYYVIRSNLSGGFATSGTVNDAAPGAQKLVDGNF